MPSWIFTLIRLALNITIIVTVGSASAQVTLNLTNGWNLMGNSSAVPIEVATTLGDASKINSVWTWNRTASKWAFYAPSMTSTDLAAYAQGKGYDVLTSIPSKDGFWVNASNPVSLSLAAASSAKLTESDLQVGWNLLSSADYRTPSQLNQILSSNMNAAGKAVVSTWAWDATSAKWRFYAPSLETQGGTVLDDYLNSKGYLSFNTSLAAADGFWVNAVSTPASATTRKAGLYYNYAKLGYYDDATSANQNDTLIHGMIDRFKSDGYTGVLFEISVGVSTSGILQHTLKYDRLFSLIDYANSIGLGTGILPNWTFDGVPSGYIGSDLFLNADVFSVLPAEFKADNFLTSIKQYYQENAATFELHRLDLLYVARGSVDFFTQPYYLSWEDIIKNIRQDYTGALSYAPASISKYRNTSIIDLVSIWRLLDAVALYEWPYVSEVPVDNLSDIVSGHYYSKMNATSVVEEIIQAGRKYKLPIMLIKCVMATNNALDGGIDPTNEQLSQIPLQTNPKMQANAFRGFFQVVSNNLYPFVTSVSVGNYEPWTYSNGISSPFSFGYFDMSRFPIESETVIKDYLSNPSVFRPIEITQVGPLNNVIYTRVGNNRVILNGGFDEVNADHGDDWFVVTRMRYEVTIGFNGWFANANNGSFYPIEIFIDGEKIGSSSIPFDAIKLALNPNGYWSDEQLLKLPISAGTVPNRISITMPGSNGGIIQIRDLSINYAGNNVIDPQSASHTYTASWSHPDWVLNGDVMSFDLSKFNLGSTTKFTSIDGGGGSDTIEFDPPQNRSYFKVTKANDLTIITDPKNIYPAVRIKNVEWIKFADETVAVQ